MGYQPIHDGKFDVAIDVNDGAEMLAMLNSVFKHKLMMLGFKVDGPAGGCPEITLRGTRRQFVAWLNDYYDADKNFVGNVDADDDSVWHAYREAGFFTFVA